MPSFNGPIKQLSKDNANFRRELVTNQHSQVVLMCIEPGEDIGEETHAGIDQVLVFVKGEGEAFLDGKRESIGKGAMVVVPAGTKHNIVNTGDKRLRLYTIYSPPEHAVGTVHATRADAMAAEGHAPVPRKPRKMHE